MAKRHRIKSDLAARSRVALAINCQAFAPGVVAETTDTRVWVHVATENQYLGYRGGEQPFRFTAKTFGQVVANIQSHPSYVVGADGFGSADIVPWDFNHASEQDPTVGSLPTVGAPAQAWSSDFQVRKSPAGLSELWAYTRFLEPARSYVKAGAYQWSSVALSFDAVDPVSGENIGALITSIALTNTPFIAGMNTLVAASHYYGGPADSPSDAFEALRSLYGLPLTADTASLLTEVGKVRQWLLTGTTPLGIELDEIIGAMRQILALPALTPNIDVLDSVDQIIQRMIEEDAGVGTAPAQPAQQPPVENAGTVSGRLDMDLIKYLASKFGVRESDDAVRAAVDESVVLRDGLIKLFAVDSHSSARVVLEGAAVAIDAKAKLVALLKALGVEDPAAGAERIATLIQARDELVDLMPELEGLRANEVVREEAAVESDVAAAMASYKIPEAAREAVLLMRRTSKTSFASKFPVAAPSGSAKVGLTQSHVAKLTSTVAAIEQPLARQAASVDLSAYPGVNLIAKAHAYLAQNHAGWANLTYDQQHIAAVALKRSVTA